MDEVLLAGRLALAVTTVVAACAMTACTSSTGAEPAPVPTAADPALVRTALGTVRGTVAADHRSCQGIPYAAPPIGELRWASPRPAAPWNGTREATRPGSACAQLPGLPMDTPSEAEDCLYLNVTTPSAPVERKLPVMVWLHGGHFLFGQGDTYGAASLAADGDVVVVTVNYRLGALGFLAPPALDGGRDAPSGNFGLEDQQAALRWVRENASGFGGDPENVTLFGESAGATSVCAHLAAPGSAGLFHRAIMQSNSCTEPFEDRPSAEEKGLSLAAALGCSDRADAASCLRSTPVTAVLQAAGYPGSGTSPAPFAGDRVLPIDPAEALASGRFTEVPVMNGINRDEYRAQLWGAERVGANCAGGTPNTIPCPLTEAQYAEQLQATFGDRADEVSAVYPRDDYGSPSEALAAVMTDSTYARAAVEANTLLARHVPVYAYEFADRQAPFFAGVPDPSFPTGAYHLAELPYLFDVDYADPLSADQRRLSEEMITYWTRFAHTGDPNDRDVPSWPRFRSGAPYVQSLAPGPGGIRPADFRNEHRVLAFHAEAVR